MREKFNELQVAKTSYEASLKELEDEKKKLDSALEQVADLPNILKRDSENRARERAEELKKAQDAARLAQEKLEATRRWKKERFGD